MNKFVLTICIGLTALFYGLKPAQGQSVNQLSDKLEQIITESKAKHAFWAVVVRDSSGGYLEKYNGQKLFTPASNLKLLTSATVLNELGPHFRFKTMMYGSGSLQDSIWKGDIIIRGSGDPAISGTFYSGYRLFVMNEFFDQLDSIGIKKIDGNLVGNTFYFDEKPYPDTWMWSDLSFYYAPQISALSFNNNTVDLTVTAKGSVGSKPMINWFAFNTDYVNFIDEQLIKPYNNWFHEYYQHYIGT